MGNSREDIEFLYLNYPQNSLLLLIMVLNKKKLIYLILLFHVYLHLLKTFLILLLSLEFKLLP